jgi:UDP-3-O-[3-hydroxymyristoyl] glucosamine N-acyltransferase
MPDPRFFNKQPSITIADINDITAIENIADLKKDAVFNDVAALDKAGEGDISFLDNVKYKDAFTKTKAGACFISPDLASLTPEGTTPLITQTPYKAYALLAQHLYPAKTSNGEISAQAHIHDTATLGKNISIAAGAVIEAGVEIGDNTVIESNAVIKENVRIGSYCRIGASATIAYSLIGDYVSIYTGCRIGQDGFGFAIDPAGFVKVPQLGRVIIEDHIEIGANTTIDRGAGPDTVIGQGTWIDNLVQIGHNVKIGKGCVIVSQVGVSGSTVIDDFVMIGGQAGVAGHLHIGKGVRVGAQSGIMRDVAAGETVMGAPAIPTKQFMRQVALLKKMSNNKN